MATWLWASLTPVTDKAPRFEMKKRFGRILAWVKVRSNSKDGFLEIGCSSRGKSTSIFVLGGRDGSWWVDFVVVLRRTAKAVVDARKTMTGSDLRGSLTTREGSRGFECARCSECGCSRSRR